MTTNNTKSYFGYLTKSKHEYNNTYHHYICKKHIDTDYSALNEIESSRKVPKFKAVNRVRIKKYKNIFSKGYINNWSR